MRRIEEVAFGPIDTRLVARLLASGETVVRTTHHDLAVELGTAREVVSRHLKRFEQRGWVRLGRGIVEIVDPGALRDGARG
jgi:CRP/FNR family transcriptional regulator